MHYYSYLVTAKEMAEFNDPGLRVITTLGGFIEDLYVVLVPCSPSRALWLYLKLSSGHAPTLL